MALLGLPQDKPVHAARRYREITAEEVQATFTKWIRLEDLIQVGLEPKIE